jgi:NAD-dependent dihydropyrimidine dehydrogenase PreA subunit
MELIYLRNVVTLRLDPDRCTHCGMCLQVCPHAVFQMAGRKVHIVDRDRCMECGACAKNCPAGAITVRAGVGCATAVIHGKLRGTEPTCDCSGDLRSRGQNASCS